MIFRVKGALYHRCDVDTMCHDPTLEEIRVALRPTCLTVWAIGRAVAGVEPPSTLPMQSLPVNTQAPVKTQATSSFDVICVM